MAETTRFYRPPITPNYAPYPAEPPKKSRAGMWILIAVLSLLFVGGGMVAMVSLALRSPRPPIAKDLEQEIQRRVKEELERVKEEIAHAQEDAQQAAEDAGDPPEPPPPPPAPSSDLEQYKYPNATVEDTVRVIGNDILNLRTKDDFAKVKEFYVKKIGEPFAESNEEGEEKLVFQSSGAISVVVSVEPDKKHPGEQKIIVFRLGFRLPRLNN